MLLKPVATLVLGLTLLVVLLAAETQQAGKVYRIAVLSNATVAGAALVRTSPTR